jgi:rRNA maturation protein Rpf1
MILVTTSRKPSPRTRSFSRDVAKAIGAAYLTRGKANLEYIFSLVPSEEDRLVMIKERRGNPSLIEVYRSRSRVLALKLSRAMLTREIKRRYGYSTQGELAAKLAHALGVEEGIVMQRGTSLMLRDGPEFNVEKVIEDALGRGED